MWPMRKYARTDRKTSHMVTLTITWTRSYYDNRRVITIKHITRRFAAFRCVPLFLSLMFEPVIILIVLYSHNNMSLQFLNWQVYLNRINSKKMYLLKIHIYTTIYLYFCLIKSTAIWMVLNLTIEIEVWVILQIRRYVIISTFIFTTRGKGSMWNSLCASPTQLAAITYKSSQSLPSYHGFRNKWSGNGTHNVQVP